MLRNVKLHLGGLLVSIKKGALIAPVWILLTERPYLIPTMGVGIKMLPLLSKTKGPHYGRP
jgi:hypothetical protein